jgi:FkbM family methyltransferase
MNALQHLAYRREFRWLSSSLGLSEVLSKWYCRWTRPQDGVLTVTVGGVAAKFHLHSRWEQRFLEAMAIYERQVLERLLEIVRPGDVFYDVGAHTGLYSILLANVLGTAGTVVAFEPEQDNFAHLTENLELNQLKNVHALRKALGEHSGEAKLYLGKVGNLSMVPPDTANMGAQAIDVVEGDAFARAHRLPVPRLVKIDVEGYEHAVLTGLRQTLAGPGCELICCEIHPNFLPAGITPEGVMTLIRNLGFTKVQTFSGWGVFHALCRKRS